MNASEIPPDEVRALLQARDQARSSKDFAEADRIRDQIDALGFEVRDSPDGATAVPKPKYEVLDPAKVQSAPMQEPTRHVSIHVMYEGHREDLERFVHALATHCHDADYEIVVTEAGAEPDDADWLESMSSDHVRVAHFGADPGWAALRNAALTLSRGAIVVVAELSVEATGDVLGPVLTALEGKDVGVAGPWGITTRNLRDFEASDGPDVDAIEGYFLAMRRELLDKVSFDEKFRWYRHADIDLSFQVRSLGFKAVVTPALADRHTHRAWAALEGDPEKREKLSKKNFNRFLERFRGRDDLLVLGRDPSL